MTTPLAPPRARAPGRTTDQTMVQPKIRPSDCIITPDALTMTQRCSGKAWVLAVFLGFGLLSGCASEPFVDGRREAGSTRPLGPSTVNRVAICYNSRSTTPETVLALAESECAKTDRVPRFDGEDIMDCSVVNPTRAYFRCVAPQG